MSAAGSGARSIRECRDRDLPGQTGPRVPFPIRPHQMAPYAWRCAGSRVLLPPCCGHCVSPAVAAAPWLHHRYCALQTEPQSLLIFVSDIMISYIVPAGWTPGFAALGVAHANSIAVSFLAGRLGTNSAQGTYSSRKNSHPNFRRILFVPGLRNSHSGKL